MSSGTSTRNERVSTCTRSASVQVEPLRRLAADKWAQRPRHTLQYSTVQHSTVRVRVHVQPIEFNRASHIIQRRASAIPPFVSSIQTRFRVALGGSCGNVPAAGGATPGNMPSPSAPLFCATSESICICISSQVKSSPFNSSHWTALHCAHPTRQSRYQESSHTQPTHVPLPFLYPLSFTHCNERLSQMLQYITVRVCYYKWTMLRMDEHAARHSWVSILSINRSTRINAKRHAIDDELN